MKHTLLSAAICSLTTAALTVNAAAQEAEQAAQKFNIGHALRFFAYFLLVMGAIYGVLMITNWVGKKWGKH